MADSVVHSRASFVLLMYSFSMIRELTYRKFRFPSYLNRWNNLSDRRRTSNWCGLPIPPLSSLRSGKEASGSHCCFEHYWRISNSDLRRDSSQQRREELHCSSCLAESRQDTIVFVGMSMFWRWTRSEIIGGDTHPAIERRRSLVPYHFVLRMSDNDMTSTRNSGRGRNRRWIFSHALARLVMHGSTHSRC
jgi:hypothetical protein